jgi:hypothetical protein
LPPFELREIYRPAAERDCNRRLNYRLTLEEIF